MPRLDIQETKSAVELTVELPGVALNEVKIEFEDDILTISGEKKIEKAAKEKGCRVSERACKAMAAAGRFTPTSVLGCGAALNRACAASPAGRPSPCRRGTRPPARRVPGPSESRLPGQ